MSSTPAEKKLTKLEVASSLNGSDSWKGFKGTVQRWAKANGVARHLEEDKAKRGIPMDVADQDVWEQVDMKIFVAVEAKLSPKIQATISSAEDAAEMWWRLVNTYEVTDMVAIVTSKRVLYAQRMLEGEKIEDHLRDMQKHINMLRGIDPSLCTPFAWMVALIASLPVSWDVFVQTLQPECEKLQIGDDVANLKVANSVRAKIAAEGQRKESRVGEEKAFAARWERLNPGKSTFQTSSNTPSTQNGGFRWNCNWCGIKGHKEADCYGKKNGKPKVVQNVAQVATSSAPANVLEQAAVATVDTEFAHMAVDKGNIQGRDPAWLVDSGANSHFVVNGSCFSLYRKTPGQFVRGVSGQVPIKGRGNVPVIMIARDGTRKQGTLLDCAHVPAFRDNLLSIP